MRTCDEDPTLLRNILFSEEATFYLNDIISRYSSRFCARKNPHWIYEVHTNRLRRLVFEQASLVNALSHYIPREDIWFQHHLALQNFGIAVRRFLDAFWI